MVGRLPAADPGKPGPLSGSRQAHSQGTEAASSSGSKCRTVSPWCGLPGDTAGSGSGGAAPPVPQRCLPAAWFWRKASTPGPFHGPVGATRRRWLGPPAFRLMLLNCLQDSFSELPPPVEQGVSQGKLLCGCSFPNAPL